MNIFTFSAFQNKRFVAFFTISALLLTFMPAQVAQAGQPEKIVICHATSSHQNPYNIQSPNKSGDVQGHDGPIWFEGIEEDWGDIIPPFDYDGRSYPGKNWDTEGKADISWVAYIYTSKLFEHPQSTTYSI